MVQNFNSCRWFVRVECIVGDNKYAIIITEGSYNKECGGHSKEVQGYLGTYRPKIHLYADQSRPYKETVRISQWPTKISAATGQCPDPPKEEHGNEHSLSKCLIG